MESLVKSLKTYRQTMQQNHPEDETQPLFHHPKEDISIPIESANTSTQKPKNTANSSSKKKQKSSLEDIIVEAVRQKEKHFQDNEYRHLSSSDSFRRNSWRKVVNKTKSRLIDPPEEERDESNDPERNFDDNDDTQEIPEEYRKRTLSLLTLLQLVTLVLVSATLICSLLITRLKRVKLWELELWKWEIFVMALISGQLVSGWAIKIAVIFFELNFILQKRVLYFVYGLKKAVQNCLWLGLVVLVWHLIFNEKVENTKNPILQYVTKILVCLLVGTFIWLLKTLLVKVLASSFHVNTFFERIQEALFNQYIIETLSGPPLFEQKPENCPTIQESRRFERKISMRNEQNRTNVSAWSMKRMINIVRLGTLSTLDEHILNSNIEDESSFHIRSEFQAKEAAKRIFLKVAKPGAQNIFVHDLMRFMAKEDALKAMHHFGAARENEGISKISLNTWLVVLMAFIFGNSCKTTFEAIIFLFVMHPFDVGDRCEVDGVQMVVEEMNILTTIFLRADKQKITYPNQVLANKPIGNFYRSPDMDEIIDFCIHISTPMEKITLMKDKIREYIEGNSEHFHPNACVIIKDVEDMNKINMALVVTHKLNYQRMGERIMRRTSLIEEMIKVFKELNIEHRLLPLDVNVRNLPTLASNRLPSNWTTCAK